MRRAILTLAVLLGACESDSEPEPVELLPAADREGGDQCTEGMPVDAVELYEALSECASAGDIPVVDASYGTLCWGWDVVAGMSEQCRSAMLSMSEGNTGSCDDIPYGQSEGDPDPSACRQVSDDVWCQVGKAIVCENENASGCETPEAINERADATLDAICG